MRVSILAMALSLASVAQGQRYHDANGRLRVALAQQPFSPNGISRGPATMANGGIKDLLAALGATVRTQSTVHNTRRRIKSLFIAT